MRKIALLFILISSYSFSQSVNDYQYVIVPAKFNFLKKEDQYRLNALTKLLLQKYGFKSYLSNEEMPKEVENQRCNFLYADVTNNGGMLITKVKVVLKDCYEKVVYETEYGTSKEKEFAIAYNQALREAGKSFDKLNYKYNGKNGIQYESIFAVNNTKDLSNEPIDESTLSPTTGNDVSYFAQPIANGYQVVDNEPKVIMKLLNTSQKNVFIGVKGDINGTVISKNGQWFFEYYKNGSLVSEPLNLKF